MDRRYGRGAKALTDGYWPATVADAHEAMATRRLSPVELAKHHIAVVERSNKRLHAVLTENFDRALDQARMAEMRMMAGSLLGPLDGIPIAHKDNFDTRGIRTTANSARYAGRTPGRDATIVANLHRAGVVMLGKTGCYEAAFAGPDRELIWPIPRNPHDPERSTAGSSSGSAVALAAGLVLGASGSDTGGSLRDPAAMCGVVGYKPRYGSVPTKGMFPFAPSLDTAGPMATTPRDVALILAGMRQDEVDYAPLDIGVRGMRIAVAPGWDRELDVSDDVMAPFAEVLGALRKAGAVICSVDVPKLCDFAAVGWVIAMAELLETHAGALAEDGGDGFGPMLRRGLDAAAVIPAFRYIAALRHARALTRTMNQALADVDALITPAQQDVAEPLSDLKSALPFEKPSITIPFCVTGAPALVMPIAMTGGLPVGVQITSTRGEEQVFRIACEIQRLLMPSAARSAAEAAA